MEIINSTENIEYLQFSKTLPNDLYRVLKCTNQYFNGVINKYFFALVFAVLFSHKHPSICTTTCLTSKD